MRDLIKRVIDLLGATALLVLFAPAMLAIALAVRLTSPGPALFRQDRAGLHGQPFRLLKFRSMQVNAPDLRNADGTTYSGEDDPRVTRLGRFIRKTSLDELPQLLNVWLGHMSLVGPRPDKVDQIALYEPGEEVRLTVKPGVTGLAQISGRNDLPWSERKRIDLEYVQRRSTTLDLVILAKTVPYVLLRRGVNQSPSMAKEGRRGT